MPCQKCIRDTSRYQVPQPFPIMLTLCPLLRPGLDTGYAPVTFPGVTESITFANDFNAAQDWVQRTADAILVAKDILKT